MFIVGSGASDEISDMSDNTPGRISSFGRKMSARNFTWFYGVCNVYCGNILPKKIYKFPINRICQAWFMFVLWPDENARI